MKTLETIQDIEHFVDSGEMRLLYASRPDCGVCKALLPKVQEMLETISLAEGAYVDLDALPEAAGHLSVFTIPAILVYVQGKESIREARYLSVDELAGRMERYAELLA